MEIELPQPISLLLIGDGEDELYAIQGELKQAETTLLFTKNDGSCVPIESEWLNRAKPITEDLKEIFGPDSRFFIPLTVGNIPEGEDPLSFIKTGLRLPTE